MEKRLNIALSPINAPIRCIYKTIEEDGPKFLFVNLPKIESSVHYLNTDDEAVLTIKGTKKGKPGRNIEVRLESEKHTVTRYRNLTIEQANDLYLALCPLGIISEVTGETKGLTTWIILGRAVAPRKEKDKGPSIPVFLKG